MSGAFSWFICLRMAVGVGLASLHNTEERRNENKWKMEDLAITKTMMMFQITELSHFSFQFRHVTS
jgi:hypothetical protein